MSAALDRRFTPLLAAVLTVGALLRFADLPADPPKGLSWSQGIYTDGAVVVQNARNQVLWGKPVIDYGIDLYWFPFSYAATLATFRALGVSSAAARATSAALGIAAIACVALAIRAERDAARSLAAAGLLAVSFPFVMYNRIPLAEPGMILLMALAFLFFTIGTARGSVRLLAASGFFAASAPLFGKAHAATFPIVGLLALALGRPEERSRLRVAGYMGGCCAAVLLWAALLFLPHGREIIDHLLHESVAKRESLPQRGVFTNALAMGARSGFFSRDLVMTTIAFCALPILVARRTIAREIESASDRFAALWLLLGWAFLACVKAPAPRYLSALFPAMAVLASSLLLGERRDMTAGGTDERVRGESKGERADAKERGGRAGRPRAPRGASRRDPRALIAVLVLAFLAAAVSIAHLGRMSSPVPALAPLVDPIPVAGDPGFPWTIAPAAGLLAIVGTVLIGRTQGRVPGIPRVAAAALLGLSVLLALFQFADWFPRRTHHLVTAGREIGRLLGPDAHLVGPYAPAVCLDNRLRVSPYFGPEYMGPDRDPDLFARHGITHVILAGPDDLKVLEERYPDVAAGLTLVAVYPFDSLYSNQIVLLRVPARIGDRRIHDYQPTEAERAAEDAARQRALLSRGGGS